ncbi:MAG: DUF5996 family protein, partial [Allosphingosinicella sp.]
MNAIIGAWPELSEARDRPTIVALHLFSQVVGKVPTAVLPWRNHGWHLALHLTPRGLRTEPIHAGRGTFELELDLICHELALIDGEGRRTLPLQSTTMARFFDAVTSLLGQAGHPARLHGAPNEVEPATPFARDDAPRSYDPESARRLLGALLAADRVFRL